VFSDFKLEEIKEVGASEVVYDTKLRKFIWPPPGGVEDGPTRSQGRARDARREGREDY